MLLLLAFPELIPKNVRVIRKFLEFQRFASEFLLNLAQNDTHFLVGSEWIRYFSLKLQLNSATPAAFLTLSH